MSANPRTTGGDNSSQGIHYEDVFAVYRMIEYAPGVLTAGKIVRLKAQADCPVDDLLLVDGESYLFHQVKSGLSDTWGADNRKLEREFLEQKRTCEFAGTEFRLIVVVAHEGRRRSLVERMPDALRACTNVLLFPAPRVAIEMARASYGLEPAFRVVRAGRRESPDEHERIVFAFQSVWMNRSNDADGYCRLHEAIAEIRARGLARLRHDWLDRPPEWGDAERILNAIPGLRWTVERGYFDWEFPPSDQGLSLEPCDGDGFHRFLRRLIEHRPSSFLELESHLPS